MSAKLMNETFPEQSKWVDREKLLNISGRGRSIQKSLLIKDNEKYLKIKLTNSLIEPI